MSFFLKARKYLTVLALVMALVFTTACGNVNGTSQTLGEPKVGNAIGYVQPERGNTGTGQDFAGWVVQTARDLVVDAYVRDNNKLGVVISPEVKPQEVRSLAKSLVQGFHKSFPNRDLTVLMYAPDRQLILTADYDHQSKQVEYQ